MNEPTIEQAKAKSTINNFDVLKRMSAEDKTIMMCPDVLNMRPNWVSANNKMMVPLENDAWVVTHYLSGDLTDIEGWPQDDN